MIGKILLMMSTAALLLAAIAPAPAKDKENRDELQHTVGAEYMNNPSAVAFDAVRGQYLIANCGTAGVYPVAPGGDSVNLFDDDGYIIRMERYFPWEMDTLPNITLQTPGGMICLGDSLFINDKNRIMGYDLANESVFMTAEMDTVDHHYFTDLATDTNGTFYISSHKYDTFYKFDLASQTFTELPLTGESFENPSSIIYNGDESRIEFVSKVENAPIQAFHTDSLAVWTMRTTNVHNMVGFVKDNNGDYYVSCRYVRTGGYDNPFYRFRGDMTGEPDMIVYHYEINDMHYNSENDTIVAPSSPPDCAYIIGLIRDTVKLAYPPNGATNVEQDIEFKYQNVSDAMGYEMYLCNDANCDSVLRIEGKWYPVIRDSTFVLIEDLEQGKTYYWKVQCLGNGQLFGAFSDTWSFTTASTPVSGPVIISPLNGATDVNTVVEFEWQGLPNVDEYLVQCSGEDNFDDEDAELEFDLRTSSTSFTMVLEHSKTFYWRVKAVGASQGSNWTDVSYFVTKESALDIPELIFPERWTAYNNLDTIDFLWHPVDGADFYKFMLSKKGKMLDDRVLLMEQDVTDTTIRFIGPEYYLMHYWQVKAINSNGSSSWTKEWSFMVGDSTEAPPELIPPDENGGEVDRRPVLRWRDQGALAYDLQIAKELNSTEKDGGKEEKGDIMQGGKGDFDNPVVFVENIKDTSYFVSKPLEKNTHYYWRVRCHSVKGNLGAWSNPAADFTTGEAMSVFEDVAELGTVEIYPNPTTGKVMIKIENQYPGAINISVHDIYGKEVARTGHAGSYNSSPLSLDLHNCAEGIYFLRIQTREVTLTEKIVLMR